MSYHRVCCCQPSCVCTGCDFASSYALQLDTLTGNWSYLWNGEPCCLGNTEQAVSHELSVTVSVAFGSDTLTRRSTGTVPDGCCYYCDTAATVTYTVVMTDHGACCDDTPVCTVTNTIEDTRSAGVCYTVVPVCVDGVCKWLHTVALCSLKLAEDIDVLLSVSGDDCGRDGLDCENLPLERFDIWMHGARWQWMTDYVALDSLDPIDFTYIGFCVNAQNCTVDDPSCSQDVLGLTPPFSIAYVPTTAYDGLPPDWCLDTAILDAHTFYWSGSTWDCAGNPDTNTDWCNAEWAITGTTCDCTKEWNFATSPPIYT